MCFLTGPNSINPARYTPARLSADGRFEAVSAGNGAAFPCDCAGSRARADRLRGGPAWGGPHGGVLRGVTAFREVSIQQGKRGSFSV